MHLARLLGISLLSATSIAAFVSSSSAQQETLDSLDLGRSKAFRVKGEKVFFYRGEFQIDADGAPKAYHPGYTCDASYPTGWKYPTNIDCAARTAETCRATTTSGFRGDPALGTVGDYVSCNTVKDPTTRRYVCRESSATRKKQGGCTRDAGASTGLDYLGNAGEPGDFYGIATKPEKTGTPFVQGPNDPAPGYYVSTTALENPSFTASDPRRYVDSSTVPYIAMPANAKAIGATKGDYVVAVNWKTGTMAGAIFADVGGNTDSTLGEGSIALASALGVTGNPKGTGGGKKEDIVYIVFAGSAPKALNGFPSNTSAIPALAMAELAKWGGPIKLMRAVPKEWAATYKK